MIEELIRIQSYLGRKSVKDIYKIVYKGKPFSLNDIYQSGNSKGGWYLRKKLKDKYGKIFSDLLDEHYAGGYLKKFDKFYLAVLYNSKHDADNIVGMSKVFADTLRPKYVPNDTKKHFKGLMVFVDERLSMNEFEFLIIDITDGAKQTTIDF
jgi:hypothetical protein